MVELPDTASYFEYACGHDGIYLQWHDGQIDEFEGCVGEHGEYKISDNPMDEFKRIGKFNSIPESYWEGVVETSEIFDPIRFPWGEGIAYKNYQTDVWGWSAKESVISAIKAEGWHVDGNPYGEEPEPLADEEDDDFGLVSATRMQKIGLWKEEQSSVISLDRLWVFERKEANI